MAAAIFYAVELAIGAAADVGAVLGSIALFVVVAVGLGALAWGLHSEAGWARTPTMVWSALWVPVSVSLFQSGQPAVAAVALALAVGTIVAVLRLPRIPRSDGATF